ncbi:MAG TPA: hypothetical protein VM261_13945 [Kofleriaceae bacterium]|nr:hypothetical protein [Kofleriaceae bacterium]
MIALGACGGGGGGAGRITLPTDARVIARGSLAYAARAGDDAIVTIELEERFALVVRDPATGRERRRVDLGPSERDLVALAVAGDRAWVGGEDREVRTIDLASGAVLATWPVGADVTALRWLAPGWLAIGDATGVVCLRRLADAALVQCAALASAPITSLDGGGGVTVVAGETRSTWTVPALAATRPAPALVWRNQVVAIAGREVLVGGAVVARLGERVRTVEVGPRGELIIAGWIARLDDPSVIVLPPRRR